ncbi:MAG TPA: hypothetical protein VGJ14_14715 [Sporichthyaceae bacterium]|jgi:hypothetical protein
MKRSVTLGAAVGALCLLAALPAGAASTPSSARTAVRLDGAVTTPAGYTLAQLAHLPAATTFTYSEVTPRGIVTHTDTGVPLETAAPNATTTAGILGSTIALPAACGSTPTPPCLVNTKNSLLRVTVTVRGTGNSVTFAAGELDPGFGNHPAYIALTRDGRPVSGGPELVVPNDSSRDRFVSDVREVSVGVVSDYDTDASGAICKPSPAAPCALPGSLRIVQGRHVTTLTMAQLAALPQETLSVSYTAAGKYAANQETGPSLDAVLRAAGIREDRVSWVTGLGTDNYATTVTPGEQWFGGRPLMISLAEYPVTPGSSSLGPATNATPRLVPAGDHLAGGRYGSDVLELIVGTD